MKRFISWTCLIVLILASLVGCNGTGGKSKEKKSLKLWMPPFGTTEALDKEFWEKEMAIFAEDNNVDVTVEIIPWANYEEKYLTSLSSQTGPDIGYMYMEMIADFIDMKAIDPFDDYLTDEDRANYLYLDKGVIQGKQYMLPILVGNPRLIIANMDILAQSGITEIPTKWDDFVAAGHKILEDSPDVYVFLQPWGNPSMGAMNIIFYPYLWQAGGELFSEDGSKAAFNSPEGIRAAQFLYDLKNKHGILPEAVVSMKVDDNNAAFLNGKAAFTTMSTIDTKILADSDINWDYAISLEDKAGGTFMAADSLVLVSASKEKELAVDMARYITSGPVMTNYHKEVAPYPPVAKDEDYNDDERFIDIYTEKNGDILHVLPPVKGSFKVLELLRQNLQLMLMDEMTAEQALAEAAAYGDEVLGK